MVLNGSRSNLNRWWFNILVRPGIGVGWWVERSGCSLGRILLQAMENRKESMFMSLRSCISPCMQLNSFGQFRWWTRTPLGSAASETPDGENDRSVHVSVVTLYRWYMSSATSPLSLFKIFPANVFVAIRTCPAIQCMQQLDLLATKGREERQSRPDRPGMWVKLSHMLSPLPPSLYAPSYCKTPTCSSSDNNSLFLTRSACTQRLSHRHI